MSAKRATAHRSTMLLALILALAAPSAVAGSDDCVDCCKSAGLAGCPTRIRVYGEGSKVVREAGSWRVMGAWSLDCERGTRFDPGSTVVLDHQPSQGEVLRIGYPASTVECFEQWCSLPADACLREDGEGGHRLLGCSDGRPLGSARLLSPGPDAPVGEAPGVRRTPPAADPPTAPATPARTGPTQAVVQTGGTEIVVVSGASASVRDHRATATSPTAPTGATGSINTRSTAVTNAVPPAMSSKVIRPGTTPSGAPPLPEPLYAGTPLDGEVPDPPPDECTVSEALQAEARKHVDLGDQARISTELQTAVHEYRAALTMDPCNAAAWSSLGDTYLSAGHDEQAIRALRVATRLRPDHYGALTSLGQAYEGAGRAALARETYQRAVDLRPEHEPALDGLARTGGRR